MTVPRFIEIRIENTNACGYKCVMCPREKQTRRVGTMSIEDFSIALDRVHPYQGAFLLHGYGEPLLDRSLVAKLGLLKKKAPKSKAGIFTTLGVRIPDFKALVHSGLDSMIVSLYGSTRDSYAKVHGYDGLDRVKANLEQLSLEIKGSPLQVIVKVPSPRVVSSLPLASQIDDGFHQWLEGLGFVVQHWLDVHNYGEGRDFNQPPGTGRLCPVVEGKRKHILNITWNLNVIPCCFDFNASIRFGNLKTQSLEEIFSSPEYVRFLLAHRTCSTGIYSACDNCEKEDYTI